MHVVTHTSRTRYRRSIRLQGYDYSRAGMYFVTLCTQSRECFFGDVVRGAMKLSQYGAVAESEWIRSALLRAEVEIGEYVVMPDHVHGLVVHHGCIADCNRSRSTDRRSPSWGANDGSIPAGPERRSIGALIAGFKSAVTARVNAIRCTPGDTVWQRGYHEHIVRNEFECRRIVDYITGNPERWSRPRPL